MAKIEQTSSKVASAASKVLGNPKSTTIERAVAASALTQAPNKASPSREQTSARVASQASQLLRDPKTSAAVKTVAATVLTQTRDKP